MSRRLVTDAKIVLERAGYEVANTVAKNIWLEDGKFKRILSVSGGTVDNQEVIDLLARRGYDEYGYKRD